ncbi:MAG TPA: hypothetical protein VGO35_07390 [Gammaproteobacteria bacterium]|jgi:hypothetical protein|nr:hypothetical protein [Gammaproteobacteria bacterium]
MTSEIDDKTAGDIGKRIAGIHRDIGYRDGAVNLADVRDTLKLDLRYYSAESTDLVDEVAHRLRLGAKRLMDNPAALIDVVKKFDLRALYIPAKKRILIDQGIPDLKKRWSEGHEITHSALPWHREYMFGDDKHTLSPVHHEEIESEANFGAGKLLFPAKRFAKVCGDCNPTFSEIKKVADHFGNTITTTFWRFVEGQTVAAFGLVSEHPLRPKAGEPAVSAFIKSPRFRVEFPAIREGALFTQIARYCSRNRAGPLGEAELVLIDDNGERYCFDLESFSNGYKVLTIGICRGPVADTVPV